MLSSFGKNSRKLRAQAWHYILTLLVAAKNQNMVSKLPQRKRAHKALLTAEKNVMSKTAELLNLDVNLPLPRDYTAEHVSN